MFFTEAIEYDCEKVVNTEYQFGRQLAASLIKNYHSNYQFDFSDDLCWPLRCYTVLKENNVELSDNYINLSDNYENLLESDVDLKEDYVDLLDPYVVFFENTDVNWIAQCGNVYVFFLNF